MELELPEINLPDFELPEIETTEEVIEETQTVVETTEEQTEVVSDPKALAYFEELKERGYVPENMEFKGTWEELDEYFDTLPQQVLNSVISSYPKESKDIMKFIATAGQNVTKEEFKKFFKTYFEEDNTVEIDTLDSAREFLTEYYKGLGMKEKAIAVELDELEENDELLDKAKSIKDSRESKVSKLIEEKEKENKELLEKQKEKVRLITEELKNTNWKQDKIERIRTLLTNENLNTVLLNAFNNPKATVQLADFLDKFDDKTKTFDLTAYKNQTLSSATKSLKEKLEKENFNSASLNTKHIDKNPSEKDWSNLVPVID